MSRILKYDLVPEDDFDKVKSLGNYISNLRFTYYHVEVEDKGKTKGRLTFSPVQNCILTQLYPDIKENMESLLTLSYFVFLHFKKNGEHMAPVNTFNVIMFKPPMQLMYEELHSSSVEFEAIFKNLARLLHVGKEEESYELKWLKEINSAKLVELIDGNVTIGNHRRSIAPESKGKTGFIDQKDIVMKDIATTVRMYRNSLSHPEFSDMGDQKFLVENNPFDNSSVVIAAKVFFVLFILIVRYRYDDLLEAIDCTIPKTHGITKDGNEVLTEEQREQLALENLNKYYIPALKESQQFYIKDVYKFTGDRTNEEAKQTIIHVRLKMRMDLVQPEGREEDGNQDNSCATDSLDFGSLELLDRLDGRMAILGEAGSGKTTLLAQLALELIRRWQLSGHDSTPKLPIRLNLTNFQAINNLMNHVRSAVLECSSSIFGQEAVILWDYVYGQLQQGNAVLLLDGLNEIKGDFLEAWNKIHSFMDDYPECQYILSSRIDDIKLYTNNLKLITESGFKLFDVCSLSGEDIQRQIRNTLRVYFGNENLAKDWFSSIKGSKSLVEMAGNPMQLMLLIRLMKSEDHYALVGMNPSVLFDSFIYEMMKYEFLKQEKKTDSALRSERADLDRALRVIACMMGQMPEVLQMRNVKIAYIESLDAPEISEKVSRILIQEFGNLLEKGKRMGLLSNGPNGSPEEISFTHQSWMEFYQSLDIVESLMTIIRNTSLSIVDEDKLILEVVCRLKEMHYFARHLKMVFELMEHREEIGLADRTSIVKCKFTIFLLEQGIQNTISSNLLQSDDDKRVLLPEKGTPMPAINNILLALSFSTASLRQPNLPSMDIDYQNHCFYRLSPIQITESAILNIMHLYRQIYPSGDMIIDVLKEIFECATQLGTKRISEELTTPYWIALWMPLDDIRKKDSSSVVISDSRDMRLLADILTARFHRPSYLCRAIVPHYLFFVSCNAKKSSSLILGHLLRLYERMDDQQLQEEAIWLKSDAQHFGGYLKHQRMQLANYALFMMKDPDYIVSHYNPDQRIIIHRTALNHLFELSTHLGIQELLLRSVTNMEMQKANDVDIDKDQDTSLRILRYLLFRFPDSEPLNKFLWEKKNAYILEKNPELVDILPIDKVPDDFITSHYDVDIFQMMRQEQKESDNLQHMLTDYRYNKAKDNYSGDANLVSYETEKNFFVPVTPDEMDGVGNVSRTRLYYSIYGRPNNQTLIILTEGMSTGEKYSKKFCRIKGVDQWFQIDSSIQAEGSFAELKFKSISPVLPYCGFIEVPIDGEVAEAIPYIYLIHRDDDFIARVSDSDWVERLQHVHVVQQLVASGKLSIGRQSISLQRVTLFSHGKPYQNERAHSTLLRVHAVLVDPIANTPCMINDGIPTEGYLSLYEFKNLDSGKLLLKVNDFSRGKYDVLRNSSFIGNVKNHGMLVAGDGQYLSVGSYIQLEDSIGYDKVVSVAKIARGWELTAELNEDIPKRGWVRFNGESQRLAYWMKIRSGNEWKFYVVKLGQDDFDAVNYETKLESLVVEDKQYTICNVRITPLEDHTFDILFGIDRPSNVSPLKKFKSLPLTFYCPVVNTIVFNDDKKAKSIYHNNKVKYRYTILEGQPVLAVPHFVNENSKLYFKINGQGECYELSFVNISKEARSNVSSWEIDTVLPPAGVDFSSHDFKEGIIHFYQDKEAKISLMVGFQYLSPLISENEPGQYHASICRHYLEECRLRHLGNVNIYHFFKIHNRSYEYLAYFLSQPEKWRREHGPIYPNVCCVVTSNASGITLFSPSLARIVLMPGQSYVTIDIKEYGKVGRIYTENADESYQLQDLAVCELNHSISHLRLSEKQRLSMFGFHKGVVTKKFKEGAGFIKAETIIDKEGKKVGMFFANTAQTEELQVGDVVNFIPSIHLGANHNGAPMASAILRIGTRRGIAEISENNIRPDKTGENVRVIIGIDVQDGHKIVSRTPERKEIGKQSLLKEISVGMKVVYVRKDDRIDVPEYRVNIISII